MKVITKQPNEGKRLLVVLLSLMLVLSSALSVIGVPLTVQAATNTIYVSAEGVDTNPGTVDDPVATLNVARTKVSSPGTIILLSDITVAETQTMGQNKTVTVQSEEGATYSIIRSENFSDNFLISITSGTATFQNLIIDGNNVKATTHGINVIATAIFKDVIIQNHHNAGGGGVSVLSASTTSGSAGEVTITGSTQIRENTLSGRDEVNPPSILGAGSGGKLVIEGGLITDNEVKAGSNGVIVGLGLSGNPIFTMTDGKIEHNKLHGNGLNASGATVGNVAVYMRGSSAQARFEFGGTAYVHDNLDEDGEQRNVFLKNTAARDNAFLSLINAMEDGAKVGVYTNIMPTSAAPIVDVAIGYNGYTATALDAAYFFSDKASSAEIKFDGESDKVILAPVPPTLDKTLLKQSTVSGNQIILTFSDGVSLDDLTGFAIQVGGENAVGTLYEVDPNNPNQLILTLSEKPTADITLTYTGNDDGNLKGQNGMPVEDFNFDYPIDFVDELSITAPTGDPAQVTETRPEVKGTVTAGSKVDVVIKDKDGNVVTGAGGEATVTDGNWTFTPSVDLAVGDYTFEVTATSQDETSVVTKTQEITVDTTQYVDYTNTEEITNIDPNDVTYDETTDKFTVPSDVTEFTFKDGDKEKKATKNPTTGEWTFTEFVDHTPTGEITNINPNGVTYDKDTGKFEVPSDVTEFTFKDGDKEKKATKNPTTGEWTFTSTVNVPYESEQVGNISPEGITHNGTDEFTVPDDVEEFTFKDGDKEVTAKKDDQGEWIFTSTVNVPYESEQVGNISPVGITHNGTDEFTVPDDVEEFTFKDGDKEVTAKKDDQGEWTFTSTVNVPYESEQVGNISPEGITHNGTDEFTVPDDVEEFTFKDGDKEVTAKKDDQGEWTFTSTVNVPYESEQVGNISPEGITHNGTDEFTVPDDVEEFTFKDGDKEVTAKKDDQGEWIFTSTVNVPYESEQVGNISPEGITHNGTDEFTVPDDVEEFTFKDGDKEVTAKKDDQGKWTFTSTVNVPYESEQVGNISPEGITHNGTDEFTVPDDVEEFTFKDGDKEITATKDTDGNWTFTTTPTVDKVPLETKYDDVKDLNKSSYTSATWGPFETAIQKAEDVLNDPNATQAEVNKALQDLEDAHKALKQRPTTPPAPTVDKSLLEDQADEANGLSEDEYTPDSWNTFKDALTDAENVLKDPNATQQQVDDALDALKDAQDKLVPAPVAPAVDKSKLQAQADGANGLTEDQYTPDSWNTFKNALIAAENVLNDPDATQQQVDNALDALQDAQNKLVPVGTPAVDKSKLQAQADGANGLTEDQYTPDSWNKFKDALTAAENVLNNPDATQQQVDDALRALQQAQNNLVPIDVSTVDKSKLQAQVDRSNNLTESNYTTGSWNAFQNALTNAKNVLADPNATQQQVDAALASLIEARNALVPYTGGNGGGGGSDGSTSTPTPTPTPEGPKKETILVDLVIDGDHPIEKTPVTIERTRETNGDVNDRVILTLSNARDAVNKAIEIGNTVARIIIPDVADEVTQVTVDIPKQSIALLQANGIDLEIFTNNVWITIPQTSMDGIEDDFYFRLVPVKDANAREAIKIRAKAQQVVRDVMQNDDITVVARPMTIETNLSSRPVLITLPLRDVTLPTDPTDPTEREAFLKQLAVFIEHTDGERKVVFGEVVTMPDNTLGLRISVSKFSTFTIINVGKKEEVLLSHEAYIKGFEDGTFKPNQDVTRKQVALMIARNLGYVDGETTVQVAPFKDVAVDADGAGAIAYLKQLGIMNGDEHGYFNGGANMTRAQMAAVVANYKKLDVTEVPLSFTDTKNHWAQYAIEANREAGIITGFEDGTFKPQAHLTRAHAVKMINRMFDRGPLYGLDALHFSDVNEQHWAFEEIAEASTTHDYMLDAQQQEWLAK